MVQQIVDVLLPVALNQTYSYRVPGGLEVRPGDLVRVPLGPRETLGAVWRVGGLGPNLDSRLRDIAEKVDAPPLPDELRRFVDWVANYTVSPPGMILRMALRRGEETHGRPRSAVRLKGPSPARLTPARARTLALLGDGLARSRREVVDKAAVSSGVIDGLIAEGTLEVLVLPPDPVAPRPDPDHAVPQLSNIQQAAAASLRDTVEARHFAVTLLDGVTGSGKTEVYFEAVAAAIRAGRQTLILMPEIALTAQFLDRFAGRFGASPAQWHSQLGAPLRSRTWNAVAAGEVSVVVGARSALFLPFAALGLIIVDEEHDPAYKQEEGVRYHARDMAVVRARVADIPIVLASATPSIETEVNARRGRYARLHLPERFGGQHLPAIEAVDLRREGPPRGRFIAPRLADTVARVLERGEQALLFLNRRGYAPLTLCRACGHRLQCPNCSAWLVDHRFRRRLGCHHCGFEMSAPTNCPNCAAAESFVACGPGVERLEEEARALFPDQRILVLSSDVVGSIDKLREDLAQISTGRVGLVIGTQLIAKGHHFPKLNLVGVIDADLGLGQGDPRAAERTFQLLHQVIGRAGREMGSGLGLVQTYQPEHPVIGALIAGDREAFYAAEIDSRERTGYPPFGRLAALVVSGFERATAEQYARRLVRCAPASPQVRVLGPAEAPIALVRGRHRFRILVKSYRGFDLSGFLRQWLAGADPRTGNLRLEIDVDPQSFL
jgi:primosomal protein N' (replication factor Y) (superfamily II helicase)